MLRGDGVDIAARIYGNGTPLILMHGGGGNLAQLGVLARALSEFQVITIDARNHGRSGDGDWTWQAVVADLDAVLEQLGIGKAVIGGYSYGGMSAAVFGAQRPQSTLAIINIDGHGLGKPEHYVGFNAADVAAGMAQAKETLASQSRAAASALAPADVEAFTQGMRSQLVELGLDPGEAADAAERALRRDGTGAVFMRQSPDQSVALLDAVDALDLLDIYRRITVPTLVFNATRGIVPSAAELTDVATLMAAYRPGLTQQLETVAAASDLVHVVNIDATHGLIFEQPAFIAEQITSFASSVASAAR
jgi:pimeloyl-ACP methyl ester carboxylesterase